MEFLLILQLCQIGFQNIRAFIDAQRVDRQALAVYNLCHLAVGNAISCLAAILVAIVVYGVVLIKLRGITERELYAIPKGAILVGVLKKCRLL